jgi:phosphoglycolate phosphatase
LAALKARGYLLAVATGKSRHGLDETLHSVQLKGVFDASRTADKTAGKPDPKMLHELMAELDTTAQRTLMVGDTTHDLQMARNAGCPSLGVSYGAHESSSFEALGPLHVAHSVQDMHDWLLANG